MDSSNQKFFLANITLVILFLLSIWACALVWLVVGIRVARGLPVVRYERRRPVPWLGLDLFLVLILSLAIPALVAVVGRSFLDIGNAAAAAGPSDTEHPIGQLLLGDHGAWIFALATLAAVVVAPITEEFMFRLMFQGWMEAVDRGRRSRTVREPAREIPSEPPEEPVDPDNPYASPAGEAAAATPRGFAHTIGRRRVLPVGMVPILLSSLLFASLHIRTAQPPRPIEQLVVLLITWQVASLLVLAAAVAVLRFRAGATLKDFGVVPDKLAADVRLGLLAYIAVCPPVYFLMFLVKSMVPENWVVDPLPLFAFAIALGFLYFRTHRIIPCIVLHAAFNGTAVFLAWLMKGAAG